MEGLLNPNSEERKTRSEDVRKEAKACVDLRMSLGFRFSSSMEDLVELFSKFENKGLAERGTRC